MNMFYIALVGFLLLSGVSAQTNQTTTETTAETTTGPSTSTSSEKSTSVSSATSGSSATSAVVTTAGVTTTISQAYTTPVPVPTPVSYTVTDTNKTIVCIVFNATIKFTLPYLTTAGVPSTVDYYLPPHGSTAESMCSGKWAAASGQLLKVTDFNEDWTFQLFFENSSNSFAATKLQLNYQVKSPFFPANAMSQNASVTFEGSYNNPLFAPANIPGYFICNAQSSITLNTTVKGVAATVPNVAFTKLTMFAFGAQNSTGLTGTKVQCAADAVAPDYIVPIVVGCALAAIILVVLIAYIIGRYRSRNTYQTV